MRKTKLLLLLLVVFLVLIGLYDKPNLVKNELVYELPIETVDDSYRDNNWLTLVSDEYDPFFSYEDIDSFLGIESDLITYKFDFDNYSYVICYGHRLKKLTYKFSNVLRRNDFLIPIEFGAQATLSKDKENCIFIYRIKKMNISYDYHGVPTVYE